MKIPSTKEKCKRETDKAQTSQGITPPFYPLPLHRLTFLGMFSMPPSQRKRDGQFCGQFCGQSCADSLRGQFCGQFRGQFCGQFADSLQTVCGQFADSFARTLHALCAHFAHTSKTLRRHFEKRRRKVAPSSPPISPAYFGESGEKWGSGETGIGRMAKT